MTTLVRRFRGLLIRRSDEGQGLVEYGLILGLIAVIAIAALNATGGNVNNLLQKVANSLSSVGG